MAITRLRKTFHYAADNSDEDDTPLELDEEGKFSATSCIFPLLKGEEQEQLIEKLRQENEEKNAEYMVTNK